MAAATFTFDEAAHLYRGDRGVVVPSVTQRLKAAGLISFAGINPGVLERKRQLGILVHKVTELYDRGESLDDFEIPDPVWEYVTGYINFRGDCDFVPEIIEIRQLAELYGMPFGMQPDRTGPINGQPHILELKCGAAEHPVWGIQLAAYATGLWGNPPKTLGKSLNVARVALQLGPHFQRGYKLHPYDDPTDYQTWACALALTTWQQNKGIFVFEDVPERLEAV